MKRTFRELKETAKDPIIIQCHSIPIKPSEPRQGCDEAERVINPRGRRVERSEVPQRDSALPHGSQCLEDQRDVEIGEHPAKTTWERVGRSGDDLKWGDRPTQQV